MEDERKQEHHSLENQIELLRRYLAEQVGWECGGEYADGGCTGTHFSRPAFCRMLEEIRAGKINCVVVKDLSRFGRNHIETGYYLEQLFPALGVRFISVTEGVDSASAMPDGLMLPIRNLINELYARDISRKVTARFAVQQKQGEFLGSLPPYGYRKDAANRHRLEVDESAAATVRQIFVWRREGVSLREIARRLIHAGTPPPGARRAGTGGEIWHQSTVGRILINPVYLGTLAQGKQKNIPLSRKRRIMPQEQWTVVESTHPALIERELFDAVQPSNQT